MSRIKKEDILELSMDELVDRISEEGRLYKNKRFAHVVSPIENPLALREMRRNIARMKTELRKRQLLEAAKAK